MRCYGGADGVTRNLWAPGIVAGVQLDLSANLRLGKGLIGERNQACCVVLGLTLPGGPFGMNWRVLKACRHTSPDYLGWGTLPFMAWMQGRALSLHSNTAVPTGYVGWPSELPVSTHHPDTSSST